MNLADFEQVLVGNLYDMLVDDDINKGITLYGDVGSGKSTIALSVANRLIEGWTIFYIEGIDPNLSPYLTWHIGTKLFTKKKLNLGSEISFGISFQPTPFSLELGTSMSFTTTNYILTPNEEAIISNIQNGFTSVKWDIRNADFLSDDSQKKYDYIFGNPPYISYADLPAESRKYLRQNFSSCKKGKFDYSYAFVEKSYNVLSQGGQLVYLVPCYIIKNVYATDIRQMIKNDLRAVIEFQGKRIFRQALVTPTIIHVEKDSQLPALQHSIYGKDTVVSISKNLIGDKWTFGKQPSNPGTRLGDKYSVSSSIATLCNDAFVLKGGHMNDMHYVIGEYRIERSILRPAPSPKSYKIYDLEEYIIFPYYFDEGNILHRYSEEEMNIYFPGCINYLTSFREKLDARCADKSAAWYEYGRSQAIRPMNQRKIMISSIISAQTKAYLLDEECIPYSGIYIFPKGNASLDDLLNIINTAEFRAYTAEIGVSVSGTSKRITPHDIEEYRF